LKINRNNNPVIISIIGYCQEIFALQAEHFPRRKTKLAMGRSSYHLNFLAQVKHFDRPEMTDWPVFKRNMTTLRKLPTTAPKQKRQFQQKNPYLCDYYNSQLLKASSTPDFDESIISI